MLDFGGTKYKFYGCYKTPDGEIKSDFYSNYSKWHSDTFSPDTEILVIVDLTVHGKTYAERKEDVRNAAIEYTRLYTEGVSLSWNEVLMFQEYFREQGKRYGLLAEFDANAIC